MASLLPFRDINVHASPSHYAFTSPSTPSAPTLVIERPTGDIRLNDGQLVGSQRVSSIAGILGVVQLKLDKYVVVITKAQPMGRLKGHMVYKVIATEFLPLRERPLHDLDEDTYSGLLKTLLKTGPMYFSYSLDLTNSFQRQTQSDLSAPVWKRADDRFFWNKHLQVDLIDFRNGQGPSMRQQRGRPQPGIDPYILPVIFGMMSINSTSLKGVPFNFSLITRRSRYRAGTRYFSRGIDETGHVSNFNETEQIVVLNDTTEGLGGFAGGGDSLANGRVVRDGKEVQIFSYVQTRGSVPVFWSEINTLSYTPKLEVRDVSAAVSAAQKHFDEQISLYGDNYLVNLVNQKGREVRVKEAYEGIVRTLVSGQPAEAKIGSAVSSEKLHAIEPTEAHTRYDRLHYVYFDFHNETKGLRWDRAMLLLEQLRPGLVAGGYFLAVDMPGGASGGALEGRASQTAVVRTNCMDCLDRTNVVQSMVARWTLTRQLRDAGVLGGGESQDDDAAFAHLFRNIWADNADVVSRAYSGTGALKTDFTRTGQRTRAGAFNDFSNSVTRYVRNNFLDGPRQDAYDLWTGAVRVPAYAASGPSAFADRRPLFVQAIPYLLAAALFLVFISILSRELPGSAVWPLRIFSLVWAAIGAWAWRFVYTHGMLYVNWPKLNPPRFATEGYNQALAKARKDPLAGPMLASHERGASTARLSHLEEGKKRIQ